MKFFLGIDGGGTRTRSFLIEADGRRAGWAESGLSNPNHASPKEIQSNLRAAIDQGRLRLGAPDGECSSIFAGMSGVMTPEGRAHIQGLIAECGYAAVPIQVDHDIRIALAGGLAGRPGIALIVGTGSSCFGRAADGRTWQTGGWEALVSDEGSAYYIGREAIAGAVRVADGRTADSPLRHIVFKWLEIESVVQILPRIHDRGLARSEIAAFAPNVIALAAEGDTLCLEILDRGAQLLAEMVAANHRMLPTGPRPDVVITGGLGTRDGIYRDKIIAAIRGQLPTAKVHQPIFAPVVGAALLAMELVGHPISPALLENLKQIRM